MTKFMKVELLPPLPAGEQVNWKEKAKGIYVGSGQISFYDGVSEWATSIYIHDFLDFFTDGDNGQSALQISSVDDLIRLTVAMRADAGNLDGKGLL